jgi:hypothetical protein
MANGRRKPAGLAHTGRLTPAVRLFLDFLSFFASIEHFLQVRGRRNRYISTTDRNKPKFGASSPHRLFSFRLSHFDGRGGSPMGMGPIAWTCLLLAVHQAPAQENFLNARDFEIGIRIDPQRRDSVRQLTLLVSRDRGATWEVGPQTPPTAKAFRFHAPTDGSYWFIVQEEDTNGRLNPRDPARTRPSQCLIVDTTSPKIDVTAEHQSNGDILARWNVTEPYPDTSSLRLEYRTNTMRPEQPWRQLPPPTAPRGEHRFPPGNGVREVIVRVRMQDKAGNAGQGEAKAAVTGAAAAASPAGGSGSPSFGVIPTVRSEPTATPGVLTSRPTPQPSTDSGPQVAPLPSGSPLPVQTPPEELSKSDQSPATTAPGNPEHPAAAPANPERPAPAPAAGFAPEAPRGDLPHLKIVNKREVRLDFEVAKVGPSGLGGADVYVTLNEGASWSKLPNELPLNWPAGADARGPGPVHGSVSVQLPNEMAIYGFIVAIKSKAGLARPAPKPGEPPQVRVELDASIPKAQLFRPAPDPNQPNALILSWSAADRNLADNPITLEWAERKDGPWTLISDHLANSSALGTLPPGATGSFVWPLSERMPSRVYLKLTARDNAGNVAIAQTDKPVLIDLSVPEIQNIVVAPH